MTVVPEAGLTDALRSYGAPASALPTAQRRLARLADAWGIRIGPTLSGATCSLVVEGTDRHGRRGVLKVPVIGEELTSGYRAARALARHGGVAVWRGDTRSGSLWMPCLSAGSLADAGCTDEEALSITIGVILRLRSAPAFRAMQGEEYFAEDLADRRPSMARRRAVIESLLATTKETAQLHGDLHHFNILRNPQDPNDGWVAIDPKGVQLDPHYEPVAFLRNPIPAVGSFPDLPLVLIRRIERFGEALDLSPKRIWAWAWAQTDGHTEDGLPAWQRVTQALGSLEQRYGRLEDAAT